MRNASIERKTAETDIKQTTDAVTSLLFLKSFLINRSCMIFQTPYAFEIVKCSGGYDQ